MASFSSVQQLRAPHAGCQPLLFGRCSAQVAQRRFFRPVHVASAQYNCHHLQQHGSAAAAVPGPAVAAGAAAATAFAAMPATAALPQLAADLAVAVDEAPVWTLDQAVGLVFGGFLLLLYLSSTQVDVFVARQQRRQLGLCEQCGGLFEPGSCAESNCPAGRQ